DRVSGVAERRAPRGDARVGALRSYREMRRDTAELPYGNRPHHDPGGGRVEAAQSLAVTSIEPLEALGRSGRQRWGEARSRLHVQAHLIWIERERFALRLDRQVDPEVRAAFDRAPDGAGEYGKMPGPDERA